MTDAARHVGGHLAQRPAEPWDEKAQSCLPHLSKSHLTAPNEGGHMKNNTTFPPAIDRRSQDVSRAINSRRNLLKSGLAMGGGAFAALALSDAASGQDADSENIAGLWEGVVSAKDNPFPLFKTFELYGGAIWISSGQTDLTLAALDSSLWATYKRIGRRTFRGIRRFWTYDANFNATGYGTVDQISTLSEDGKT
jgi:hypothetical protein